MFGNKASAKSSGGEANALAYFPEASVTAKKKFYNPDRSSTVIIRCDSFSVGRGQESGRCWGDLVSIHSPNNDTLTLCGQRNGLHLTLEGYSDSLEVRFVSKDGSASEGFSCLVYTKPEEDSVNFGDDPDFDCKEIWRVDIVVVKNLFGLISFYFM